MRWPWAIEAGHDTSRSASRAAECATHWYLSGDEAAALGAAITAGRLAAEVYAYTEASKQFERAMELWDRVGQTEVAGMTRLDLLLHAAESARWTSSPDEAVELATAARALARGRRPTAAG